jgi:hypothetical protein
VRTIARNLPPGNLRRWLQSEKTASFRLNLYAYLLGHCGDRKADAALLRKLLDRIRKDPDPMMADRVLVGYTLLDPRAGAAYVQGLLADPTTDFCLRYAGLKAAQYFSSHPGVLTENEVLDAVGLALAERDLADIAVEHLREWKCWKLTGKVLPLFDRKGFALPGVRRSIVRYALQCPGADAGRFVKRLRKTDSSFLREVEDELKDEKPPER